MYYNVFLLAGKIRPSPSLSWFPIRACGRLFMLFNAAGLRISSGRTQVGLSAAVQKMWIYVRSSSASTQCLSQLSQQKATVANISLKMWSAGLNYQTTSSTTQMAHEGPWMWDSYVVIHKFHV